ncbi:MAG: nucleotidyltransferase domain-containing protein [Chloroflexi bacterium]|nr:nucleotidyltransferase domain-containing protein [Chloroflexota bacterium]
MIEITPEHLKIVLNTLERLAPECEARVFGSRYTGKAKKYSNLDIVLVGTKKIDWRQIAKIKEAFEESTLPYRVDVLDWNAISLEFRKVIEDQGYEVIRKIKPQQHPTINIAA